MSYQKPCPIHSSLVTTSTTRGLFASFFINLAIPKQSSSKRINSKTYFCKKHVMLHKQYDTSKAYLAYSFTLTRYR